MKRKLFVSAFIALTLAAPAFSETPAELYKSKCAACHGADGKGATPVAKALGVRDLTSGPAAKETDAEWITITTKGKDKMPAYNSKLTADQIKELVKYMRTLK